MNLLPVGDGHTYIDVDKATKVRLSRVKYYKSEDGVWVRKESRHLTGQVISEQEAFIAFMNANRFAEAKKYFPMLFEDGAKLTVVIEQPVMLRNQSKWRILRFAAGGIAFLLVAASESTWPGGTAGSCAGR